MRTDLEMIREGLLKQKLDLGGVEQTARMLVRCRESDLPEAFAQFHNAAGALNHYVHDRDYGAMLLQDLASDPANAPRAQQLLQHAIFRARWCAQAATSGGEGLARASHLHELGALCAAHA